jgi:hypothetical protein
MSESRSSTGRKSYSTNYLAASPGRTIKTDNWKRSVYEKKFTVTTPHQDDPGEEQWVYANTVSIPAWRASQSKWEADLKAKHGKNVTIQHLGSGSYGNGVGYSNTYKVILDENSPTYSSKAPTLKSFDKVNREGLLITKDKEGKSVFVNETNKAEQVTAEDVLKKRLNLLSRKGRITMPSGSGTSDEPTINISSGGAVGLNFA